MATSHIVIRVWCVMLGVALLSISGCYTQLRTTGVAAEPGAEPSEWPVDLSISIAPAEFAMGDTVEVEIILFNPSSEPIEMLFPSSCNVDFQIRDSFGRVVAPSRMCSQVVSTLYFDPFETRRFAQSWEGTDGYFDAVEEMKPGTYLMTAGFVEGTRFIEVTDPIPVVIKARGRVF
jgi:hypothetical protein